MGDLNSLGNRPHPSDAKPLFAEGDPRLQFTVSEVDPRIHFALVCGAKVLMTVFPCYYLLDSLFCVLNTWEKWVEFLGSFRIQKVRNAVNRFVHLE